MTSSSHPSEPDGDVADKPIAEPVAEAPPEVAVDGGNPQPVVDGRSDTERERDEYLDTLRHLQADFENYKKRVARQFEDLSTRGVLSLVDKLLPVLDALDLAEGHLLAEAKSDGTLAEDTKALVQARALLLDTLAKEGLEPIGIAGEPFDPTVHDAVAHSEGDDGPLVDEVLRAGYQWRGQVLRPAMVRVKG